jgi:hypothetical protein
MLSHTAGFTAWIPFYTKTLKDGKPDQSIYRTKSEEGYTSQVAAGPIYHGHIQRFHLSADFGDSD